MNPWREFLDIEETENKIIKGIRYILRKSRGIFWPISYLILLITYANTQGNSMGFVITFAVVWFPLALVGFLFPISWEKFYSKRRAEFDDLYTSHCLLIEYINTQKGWTQMGSPGNHPPREAEEVFKRFQKLNDGFKLF